VIRGDGRIARAFEDFRSSSLKKLKISVSLFLCGSVCRFAAGTVQCNHETAEDPKKNEIERERTDLMSLVYNPWPKDPARLI
jgi:hypothetical protein